MSASDSGPSLLLNLPLYIQHPGSHDNRYYMRYLLARVTLRGEEPDTVATGVSCVEAPYRPGVDIFFPADPFYRPIFIVVRLHTSTGIQVNTIITIFFYDWEGGVAAAAYTQPLPKIRSITVGNIRLNDVVDQSINESGDSEERLHEEAAASIMSCVANAVDGM
ncbi:hypothetical protein C8Q78DRAFT_1081428 [Trametes maxima]|nr:hypothetical protein C8Q78DRAFT_1081428 [Trametes maxima]